MEAEKIVLIFNRICGYSGRFFYVEGDHIVERGDWVKGGERVYTLVEAERWLAVELYSKKVITLMELQPLEDRMKRLKSYIEELGPEGRRLLMAREERAKKEDETKDMTGVTVEVGEGDGTNIITQSDQIPAAAQEAFESMDAEGKQPIFDDARIEAEGKEAKKVLAMVEAVKDYALVMDACLEEAKKLIPDFGSRPGLEEDRPQQAARFEARTRIALALYNRATARDPQPDVDKYLDRLIEWYEAKDDPPAKTLDAPPFPVPPPFYTARVSATERLADLLLDFLESRVGVIFGEVDLNLYGRDRDGAKAENNGAPRA